MFPHEEEILNAEGLSGEDEEVEMSKKKYKSLSPGDKCGRLFIKDIVRKTIPDSSSKSKTRSVFYARVLCDCGVEKEIRTESIKKGLSQSCGCMNYRKRSIDPASKAVRYFSTYMNSSAKKRGIEASLTLEDVRCLIFKSCAYCGSMPTSHCSKKSEKTIYQDGMAPFNGLDRIDSSKGYTLSNVVPCCSACNTAKLDMTLDEFKEHIAKIHSKINILAKDATTQVSPKIWKYYDGQVILADKMGGDLSVVNAARVSFGKQKSVFEPKDESLIRYLADHKHMSPFRHVQITLILQEIPEFILRQLYKHQVGIAYTAGDFREAATVWNELSGRYVEFGMDFFEPVSFRQQHESNKQASHRDRVVKNEDEVRKIYRDSIESSWRAYNGLISSGVSKEQARLVIPLAFKTSVVWTASLEALVHFVRLRNHEGAQVEIQTLAEIVHKIVIDVAPVSTRALLGDL